MRKERPSVRKKRPGEEPTGSDHNQPERRKVRVRRRSSTTRWTVEWWPLVHERDVGVREDEARRSNERRHDGLSENHPSKLVDTKPRDAKESRWFPKVSASIEIANEQENLDRNGL
mmetsp:Transcript_390/g.2990  ORF Transcript_390/g.2990 Transcript_390/m.2990 type:complete len:116 (+) Transcript_390:317-664(+)